MGRSPGLDAGKRAARAGKPQFVPPKWQQVASEWMRGYLTEKPAGVAAPGPMPDAGASPPPAPPPAPGPTPDGDPGPGDPGPDAEREADNAIDAAGIPDAAADAGAIGQPTGGTCYTHGLGAERCVAVVAGVQCPKGVVRPIRQVACDRIARRALALVSTMTSVIADVPDPGVEDAEAEGLGAGLHAASERIPGLNENVGDLALGGLTLVGYATRLAVQVRRDKAARKTRADGPEEKDDDASEK